MTEELGSNLTAPEAPPSEAEAPPLIYVMGAGERFSREQYHLAGWTDAQLIQTGRMEIIAPPPEALEPIHVGMPERVWIILEEHDDIPPTGQFVGHNGVGYLLRTGVPIPVPRFILDILDQAVITKPVIDNDSKKVTGWAARRRFNYRPVDAPVDAEAIAA